MSLFHAVGSNDIELVEILLAKGANINEEDEYGCTPLFTCVRCGYTHLSKVLLMNDANVNAVDNWKSSPLHCAARNGHIDILQLLIMYGANVNALDDDDESPLYRAVVSYRKMFRISTMLQLICTGARIDEKSSTADRSGVLQRLEDRLNLLRERKPIKTDLFSVEERRYVEYVALCFAKQYHEIIGKKLFYMCFHLISFHGIFMTRAFQLGNGTLSKTPYP